jgi:chemotaxis protein CheX
MDVNNINPALTSLVNVLTTMANITPSIGKPSIKKDENAPGVVTGLIDLVGKETTGSLAISFSKPVALEIAKNMLQIETDVVNDMVQDLVGELANMVAGGAKAIYNEQGINFELTLPKVLVGDNHQIVHSFKGTTILLPFTTDAGEFYIEACFSK